MDTERKPTRPSTETGGDMNRRGGRVEIRDHPPCLLQEMQEESFPASDAPKYTPDGYVDRPPTPKH